MVHGSQLGLLYGVLNGQQLPGLLLRLVIVSSSGSNVGNVSGIAGGDVDRDRATVNESRKLNPQDDQTIDPEIQILRDGETTRYLGAQCSRT